MKRLDLASKLSALAITVCASAWAQTTTLVSVDSSGVHGNSSSYYPSISSDGRYVAFTSFASNLVPGDTNGTDDVFVHDLQSGVTTRVSVDSNGAQVAGSSGLDRPSISAGGRFVAFPSYALNLVPGDTNGSSDIFVHDRQGGATTRVSVNSGGFQSNGYSAFPSISSDGRYVAFWTHATNLVPGDTNGVRDVFVHDRQSGTTTRVSVDSSGAQGNDVSYLPELSSDGRYVAFVSLATNLVSGDTNGAGDVFLHDRHSGATVRVSVDSGGAQSDGYSASVSISFDGRYVAFASEATNLVPGDTNGTSDVFVHDRQSGATTRVSVDSGGTQADSGSYNPSISSAGRYLGFASYATNLVPGDTNGTYDAFVHDRQSGATMRVSVDSGGVQANGSSGGPPLLSSDGRFVAFTSEATNLALGDTSLLPDVFVHDRGVGSAFTPFCFGDGSVAACPCANSGIAGHGCENSSGTGGALLSASGVASLSVDTVQLTSSGELPTSPSVVLQGSSTIAPAHLADGLRCERGILRRMYVKNAIGGVVTAPLVGEPSISARSAALGDPIPLGATRYYQVYYRDPVLTFCPNPPGNSWNVSNGIAIAWGS